MTNTPALPHWLGPAVVAAAFLALAATTWGRWPDVLVDFGREAYVAWRLAEGDALYADVAWFNGPLSAHWNAAWFALLGPSLHLLFAINLALLAVTAVLAFRIVAGVSDRASATLAALAVVVLCGFAHLTTIGNYNFVAPYSHEATHGLICGLAAIACIGRWARAPSARWLVLGGMSAGLALLTKAEMALAALVAPALALSLSPAFLPRRGAVLMPFAGGLVVPLLASGAALALQAGGPVAWEALSAPWRGLLAADVARLPYYRASMGLEASPAQWAARAAVTLGWLAAFLVPSAAALAWRRPSWRGHLPEPLVFLLVALFPLTLLPLASRVHPSSVGLVLPIVVVAAGTMAWRLRAGDPGRALTVLALATFALILLGKMLLYSRLHHYGFVLAVPALLLAMILAIDWVPQWVSRAGGRADLARTGSLALIVAVCVLNVSMTAHLAGRKTVLVGDGADRFRADARGAVVRNVLDDLAELPHDATLAVLPEGVMLNYLARRRNPTPYVTFMPPELLLFGEDAMLTAFRAHPPDRIVLVHKDTTEYGFPRFGRDYGRTLMAWIREHYRLERVYGDPPLEPGSTFGIALLSPAGATP